LIGCRSLTIHRVESVLLAETRFMALPSCQQLFDCVTRLQFLID
jgi:hypothetical protein